MKGLKIKKLDLLPFQIEAKEFVKKKKASILSLATGLGKTITSISAFKDIKEKSKSAKCIYITEDSILPQSVDDMNEHFDFNIIKIYKTKPVDRIVKYKEFVASGDILVLNYHILIRDAIMLREMIVQEQLKVLLILDEANNVRNCESQMHKASNMLSKVARKSIALTATPSKQRIDDIFNTLKAINVNVCNNSAFRKHFEIYTEGALLQVCHKGNILATAKAPANKNWKNKYYTFHFSLPQMKKHKNSSISKPQKGTLKRTSETSFQYSIYLMGQSKFIFTITDKDKNIQYPFELVCYTSRDRLGFKNIKKFMELVEPYMFAKSKRSVSDTLPRYTIHKRVVDEDTKAKEAIKYLYTKPKDENSENNENKTNLVNYAQMLIAQSVPQEYLPELDSNYKSTKIKEVFDILENNVDIDDKVVIYSPWRKIIDRLYDMLLQDKLNNNKNLIAKISGGNDTDNNSERIKFQENADCKILLMTDAGTRGLNLQVANHIIFLNMPKDAGDYDQVGGRLPRVGSKHISLSAYFIMADNTIDTDHFDIIMGNYAFMRSLNSQFGDETLQDTTRPAIDIKDKDKFVFKKLENRRKQYLK